MKKQRICIVGDGLSGLMTALALNKLEGVEVLLISRKNMHFKDRRTTAISASNYEFFNKVIDKLDKKLFWPSKKINLFYETKDQNMNFLNFNEDIKNLMYVFENDKIKEILIKEGKNYFDTNTTSHHHFYDEINNELTDIENNKIELKKFPTPPKGKSIKDVNVIINIDNDNQKH